MKKTIIALFLLSVPAVWFLLTPGGYEPHDLHHLADIDQMYKAFVSGQIPPRLGPDFLFGYGYPLFNFYYVLPFYLGAAFYFITGNLMTSFELVFVVSALVSVYGMYMLLGKFFGKWASVAGAILYLYTPFRAVEIYVRGAIGEALAIALFPWVLYFLICLVKQTSKKTIIFASFALALFFITHNYFFLMVAPFTVLFSLALIYSEKKKLEKVKALFAAGVMSMGLSAFWWLPAFAEYKSVASSTPFVLIDHFPFIKQLILPSWGYGSSVWGPYDEVSFQVGIANLAIVALASIILVKQRKSKNISFNISLLAAIFFFASIFMMNIRSLFIWNIIPFTNFIQFPWRLLVLTTFFSAFLAGYVIDNSKFKKVFSAFLIFFCILLTFGYFRPSKTTNRADEEYRKLFFSNPQYSEDYLQLPLGAEKRPDFASGEKFVVENGVVVSEMKLSDIRWEAEVEADGPAEVNANVLNFPGWFVKVDGEVVETYATGPYGQLTFSVDGGAHNIELYWAETGLRLLADLVSLTSLFAALMLYFRHKASRATI